MLRYLHNGRLRLTSSRRDRPESGVGDEQVIAGKENLGPKAVRHRPRVSAHQAHDPASVIYRVDDNARYISAAGDTKRGSLVTRNCENTRRNNQIRSGWLKRERLIKCWRPVGPCSMLVKSMILRAPTAGTQPHSTRQGSTLLRH